MGVGLVEACSECSLNCSMNHSQNTDQCSSSVSSFFKVMFGKHFSDILIVPPRFTRKLAQLVAKRTYLEDSIGHKWNVILSNVNGSLAFKEGWREFCEDHGIQVGDFVVFHCIRDSHFAVQIYGSSGCEKLSFSGMNYHNNITEPTRNDPFELTPSLVSQPVSIYREDHVNDHKTRLLKLSGNVVRRNNDIQRLTSAPAADSLVDSRSIEVLADKTETRFGSKYDKDYLVYLSTLKMPDKGVVADKTSELQLPVTVKTEPCSNDVMTWHVAEADTVSNRGEALLPVCVAAEPIKVLQRQDDLIDVKPSRLVSNLPKHTNITRTVKKEDPCYMINRDTNTSRELDRQGLFDLSTFEKPIKKAIADKSKKPRFQGKK